MKVLPRLGRGLPHRKLPAAFLVEARSRGWQAALRKTGRILLHRGGGYFYSEQFHRAVVRRDIAAMARRPLISVLMPVYNAPPRWIRHAVASVRAQLYPEWELCIADDHSDNPPTLRYLRGLKHPRIQVHRLNRNRGIAGASNEALALAGGEYVVLLDHDDELTRDALYELVLAAQADDADLIYSDEDMIDGRGRSSDAHFKPDYSPDLLLSHNYVTHMLAARRALVERVGGFRSECDGAQDYDLVLRLSEEAERICHIRKVLYHWRGLPTSTSRRPEAKPYTTAAGQRAVQDALRRRGIAGSVEPGNLPNYYRTRRDIRGEPRVSIIIPFRDRSDLLEACVRSVLDRSSYPAFEILGANNDSREPDTRRMMRDLAAADSRVRFIDVAGPFNYSHINNAAVAAASGEHIVLLNNDIEILSPHWIQALLEHSQRAEVGAVGGKLYYPSGAIQHAGVVIGITGFAGHSHRGYPKEATGYFNRLYAVQNVSAVTGALLMVKTQLYRNANGLDAVHLPLALNDVDFCLRLQERGHINIFTPYCEANHHESASRGYEVTEERKRRFAREIEYFQTRHRAILEAGDPYYNRNLTLAAEHYGYNPDPHPLHRTRGLAQLDRQSGRITARGAAPDRP